MTISPTSEAALFEAGKSRTLVPSRKQGYNYHNTQLFEVAFHSPQACLTPFAGIRPGPHRLSSVSQIAQPEEQPPPPFESVICAALAWHNPPAQGASEPHRGEPFRPSGSEQQGAENFILLSPCPAVCLQPRLRRFLKV